MNYFEIAYMRMDRANSKKKIEIIRLVFVVKRSTVLVVDVITFMLELCAMKQYMYVFRLFSTDIRKMLYVKNHAPRHHRTHQY